MTNATRLRRALAIGILTVAGFQTLASLSLPRPDMKPAEWRVWMWLVLLVAHAALYWFANDLRTRLRDTGFLGVQAAIVFVIGISGALFPVGAGLYIALTIYAVITMGGRWNSMWITFGAVLLFAVGAIVTSNTYRGATVGLLLAIAGVVGHAIAALVRREPEIASAVSSATEARVVLRDDLTPRESEVLDALVGGARNNQIASRLGISERTVKAHLASIYMKLGVDSRLEAVAVASRKRESSRP